MCEGRERKKNVKRCNKSKEWTERPKKEGGMERRKNCKECGEEYKEEKNGRKDCKRKRKEEKKMGEKNIKKRM